MLEKALYNIQTDYFPPWPCPICGYGTLTLEEKTLARGSADGVQTAIRMGLIDEDNNKGVFVAILSCTNEPCKQGVSILGNFEANYEKGEGGQWEINYQYSIHDIYPAPNLIMLPKNTSKPISDALKRSFAFYWRDTQACVTTIRIALEFVADHLNAPREGKKGGFIPLMQRLRSFSESHPELIEAANLIIYLANAGTHGADIERDKLISVYELVEIELQRLFDNIEDRRRSTISRFKGQLGRGH